LSSESNTFTDSEVFVPTGEVIFRFGSIIFAEIIEVRRISIIFHLERASSKDMLKPRPINYLGSVGCDQGSFLQGFPTETFEPSERKAETSRIEAISSATLLVLLNIFDAAFLIANPFYWILSKEIPKWRSRIDCSPWSFSYRHSRLINNEAIFETFLGNSMASMPFKITLYVFIGSEPENGALNDAWGHR
jgi:hypothetical protein